MYLLAAWTVLCAPLRWPARGPSWDACASQLAWPAPRPLRAGPHACTRMGCCLGPLASPRACSSLWDAPLPAATWAAQLAGPLALAPLDRANFIYGKNLTYIASSTAQQFTCVCLICFVLTAQLPHLPLRVVVC